MAATERNHEIKNITIVSQIPCHLIAGYLGLSPSGPDAPRPLDRPFVPLNLMPNQGSPVPLLKIQT